jgi:hypothetical protein
LEQGPLIVRQLISGLVQWRVFGQGECQGELCAKQPSFFPQLTDDAHLAIESFHRPEDFVDTALDDEFLLLFEQGEDFAILAKFLAERVDQVL